MQNIILSENMSKKVNSALSKFKEEFDKKNIKSFQINYKKGMMITTFDNIFGKNTREIYSENETLCEWYLFDKKNNYWTRRDFHPTLCGQCYHGNAYEISEAKLIERVNQFQEHEEIWINMFDCKKMWESEPRHR